MTLIEDVTSYVFPGIKIHCQNKNNCNTLCIFILFIYILMNVQCSDSLVV